MLDHAPVLVSCVRCLRLHVPADLHVANPCCPACRAKAAEVAAARALQSPPSPPGRDG